MLICDNDQTLANDNERVLIVFQIYYHTTKMAAPAILCHGSLSLSLSLSLSVATRIISSLVPPNYLHAFHSVNKFLCMRKHLYDRFKLCIYFCVVLLFLSISYYF